MLHGRHCMQHEDITMTAEIGMAKAIEKNTTNSWNKID